VAYKICRAAKNSSGKSSAGMQSFTLVYWEGDDKVALVWMYSIMVHTGAGVSFKSRHQTAAMGERRV
jgi:hypothetical protein